MDKYKIAETEHFQKKISKTKYKNLYKKITDYVYPFLRKNPYFGANIKKLKGELTGLYRYRIGKFRLFYETDNDKVIVFIVDIEDRKDAYN
ncbi:type II toxin-antitoxin system RelE family toxin [Sediminispirochaeta smaragdinae]|uniref:Plasmid stabilization system n=1 Tax=Sediminispirochaeta smaragdinae (strain DSM 11293 / JCM 15392 / SEBR 4228) TaxID=573413 RepID=E1R246_SEDSS|nr:type II toxin-antitoxin system RelE/ParE family toxin [Sediminispirochaeta smaragdinae]ADK81931.1 plasmid stabilization system [Sediminispirochaeta smaragdinae DSM 11293]